MENQNKSMACVLGNLSLFKEVSQIDHVPACFQISMAFLMATATATNDTDTWAKTSGIMLRVIFSPWMAMHRWGDLTVVLLYLFGCVYIYVYNCVSVWTTVSLFSFSPTGFCPIHQEYRSVQCRSSNAICVIRNYNCRIPRNSWSTISGSLTVTVTGSFDKLTSVVSSWYSWWKFPSPGYWLLHFKFPSRLEEKYRGQGDILGVMTWWQDSSVGDLIWA